MSAVRLRATSHEPRAALYAAAKLVARGSWLVALIGLSTVLRAQESHIPLHEGWTFCQAGKEKWYTAEVPGVVQTDLLRHGLIPDFYKGSNIDSVQWIENEDWIYKRTIVANDSLLKRGHVDLVFKGLDTFAEVYLNDSLLGKADNMFRTWEWPIKDLLKPGANELKVIFRSPIKEGAKLRDAYGIQLPHDNDPSGVSPYIRKAAYQFGWDFCPRLVTSGIWQGVELRGWSKARIVEVSRGGFGGSGNNRGPELFVIRTVGSKLRANDLCVRLDGESLEVTAFGSDRGSHTFTAAVHIDSIARWFPRGSGPQGMHELSVELRKNGLALSSHRRIFGENAVGLDKNRDATGNAFCFRSGRGPIYAKGCNLIPPSLIAGPGSEVKWLNLVHEMQRAGMNMCRVWAGGVYPPETFYAACDTAGIMVWQDLMFGNVPSSDSASVTNIIAEVKEQVGRARMHPSVVLFCGNNELDVAWHNWGWQTTYGLHGSDSISMWKSYEHLFKELLTVIASADGRIPYVSTSPLSNWGNAEGLKSGDLHYWGVWHGDSAFSSFKNNVGRFVSEYGFQSYPDSALLSHYIDPKELYLGSPAMKRMQRSYKTDKPIWDAIKRELVKEPKTLGEFIEDSQEVQAKAYRMAIEAHMAAQPHCMGTLFWQLNDCWPGPSWSLIDFEGNWKPGMYQVQRLYQGK